MQARGNSSALNRVVVGARCNAMLSVLQHRSYYHWTVLEWKCSKCYHMDGEGACVECTSVGGSQSQRKSRTKWTALNGMTACSYVRMFVCSYVRMFACLFDRLEVRGDVGDADADSDANNDADAVCMLPAFMHTHVDADGDAELMVLTLTLTLMLM